jgi:hypothetical protein
MKSHVRTLLIAAPLVSAGASAHADPDLQRAAVTTGFTPSLLTACGFSAQEIGTLFDNVRGTPQLTSLLTAQNAAAEAELALKTALRTCDPLTEDGYATVLQATASNEAARCALAAASTSFLSTCLGGIEPAKAQRLAVWRALPPGLPPELKVVAWSEVEAKDLLAALLEERLAATGQGSISPASVELLAQARARPEVVEARSLLQAHLDANTTAFDQATAR